MYRPITIMILKGYNIILTSNDIHMSMHFLTSSQIFLFQVDGN